MRNARFECIVRDHLPVILRLLERFGVPPTDIEDVAQEVLHGAYRAFPKFDRSRATIRTWLFRITFHQAQTFLDRAHHRREVVGLSRPTESAVEPEPRVEQVPSGDEARRLVHALIGTLRVDRRAVFVAYEIEERPMPEIAALLGIPVSTGWSRLFRARIEFTRAFRRWQRASGEPPRGSR